jgi:site-specific DNA-methyltransferase (adenine-specific)
MYRLYNGDCLEVMDRLIEEGVKVDAIICDLPYGTTKAKWDIIIPFNELWSRYEKLIKKDGAIVLFGSQPFTSKLIMSKLDWFKEELIWEKDRASNFANAKYRHLKYHENIMVFSNGNLHITDKCKLEKVKELNKL